MSTEQQLVTKVIPLKEIVFSDRNPRKTITPKEISELAESMRARGGPDSPIMVRPLSEGKNKGKYELVYGERRYRAAGELKLEGINSIVKELTDEDAEQIQFIENLARVDVHPMDEATKFAEMIGRKKNPPSIKDIAAMIHKSEAYVAQRLELNHLLPVLQKDFWAGKFHLAMAIEFARLKTADQKEAQKYIYHSYDKTYSSISQLRGWIERNVMKDLKKATFDTKNPDLNPKMGACTTCPQRSGANVLFADVKEKDICFNTECFALKTTVAMMAQIDNVITKHPDIVFVSSQWGDAVNPLVVKKLKDEKIDIVRNDTFTSYKYAGAEPVKVMNLNGSDIGKILTVYKQESSSGKAKKQDIKQMKESGVKQETLIKAIDDNIDGINARRKRSEELDAEKVWSRIHSEIIPAKEMVNNEAMTAVETAALLQAMSDKIGYHSNSEFGKIFSKVAYKPADVFNLYLNCTDAQFNQACRVFIRAVLDNTTGSHLANSNQYALHQVANQYKAAEIAAIQAEQDAIAAARKERADARIETLKKQKKELQDSKAVKKAAKLPAKQQAA